MIVFQNASGAPVGATVTATLLAPDTAGSYATPVVTFTTTVALGGRWQFDGASELHGPAKALSVFGYRGTYWQITVPQAGGGDPVQYTVVATGTGPAPVTSLPTVASPQPVFGQGGGGLTQAAADARYVQTGSGAYEGVPSNPATFTAAALTGRPSVVLPSHKADALTVTDGAMAASSGVVTSAWTPTSLGTAQKPAVGQKIVITPVALYGLLSSALSTGAAITSLPINSWTPRTTIPAGATVTVQCGSNSQTFTTSSALAGGTAITAIPVNSQTPTYAFPGAAFANNAVCSSVTVTQAPIKDTVASVSGNNVTLSTATASAAGIDQAVVVYGTDNYALIAAAVTLATSTRSKLIVPQPTPSAAGYTGEGFLYDGTLALADRITIEGDGVSELVSTAGTGLNPTTYGVDTTPWLAGSVLICAALSSDAIQLTGKGKSYNLVDFGIRFAAYHNSTGHGIYSIPPALSTYQDHGPWSSKIDGVKVHGHDGNHYAFNLVNPLYLKLNHLRSYGGGGLRLYGNSTVWYYGNADADDCYSTVMCAGSAHGLNLDGAGNPIQLLSFDRPQFNVVNQAGYNYTNPASTPIPAPPTGGSSGQLCEAATTNSRRATFLQEDFETNVGAVMAPVTTAVQRINAQQSVSLASGYGMNANFSSSSPVQNLSGRDILVTALVALTATGTAATVDVYVGGSNPPTGGNHVISSSYGGQIPSGAATGTILPITFLVPSGNYYEVVMSGCSRLGSWAFGPLDGRDSPN